MSNIWMIQDFLFNVTAVLSQCNTAPVCSYAVIFKEVDNNKAFRDNYYVAAANKHWSCLGNSK